MISMGFESICKILHDLHAHNSGLLAAYIGQTKKAYESAPGSYQLISFEQIHWAIFIFNAFHSQG